MKYSDYIKLGFKRTDLADSVEFDNTGYHGFVLEKVISKKMLIDVCSGELDNPKLYIKKPTQDQYHILPITTECVKDLCYKDQIKSE